MTKEECEIETSKAIMEMKSRIEKLEKENAELKEQLKKWKDEWQEQVQKANDEGYARTLQTIKLTKAKEIINELIELGKIWLSKEDDDYSFIADAEQFLKECE